MIKPSKGSYKLIVRESSKGWGGGEIQKKGHYKMRVITEVMTMDIWAVKQGRADF